MTGEVAIETDHAAGEQLRAAAHQPGEQRLLPGPGTATDRAQHGTAGTGSQRDDPDLTLWGTGREAGPPFLLSPAA